jgi:transposase-like protein
MADELSIALLDLLRKADPVQRTDFVRQAVERLAQAIVEVEVEQKVGAARYERTETRNNSRNGARAREWDTTAGTVHLPSPSCGTARFFPCSSSPAAAPIAPWPTWSPRPTSRA